MIGSRILKIETKFSVKLFDRKGKLFFHCELFLLGLNLMFVALMMESVSLGCVMFQYGTSESQIENHTYGQSV
jgi:hypothetical protein